MKNGICPNCKEIISLDENNQTDTCPKCNQVINNTEAIRDYYGNVANFRHKGDVAFENKGDYEVAFKNYESLYSLANSELGVLIALVISKLRCSTLSKLTIKEAVDLLLKGSDLIEITYDNVITLSDFLVKIRLDANEIVDAYSKYASDEDYHEALNEYKYYLESYLKIYNALTKMNQYFKDSLELINDEINRVNGLLKSPSSHLEVPKGFMIFKPKKFEYIRNRVLWIVTGIGLVTSIVGITLLSALKNNPIASGVTLGLGLIMFVGGYFLNHYLTYTRKNKK